MIKYFNKELAMTKEDNEYFRNYYFKNYVDNDVKEGD